MGAEAGSPVHYTPAVVQISHGFKGEIVCMENAKDDIWHARGPFG